MHIISVHDDNLFIYLNLVQAYEAEFSVITQKFPNSDGLYSVDTVLKNNNKGFLFYDGQQLVGLSAIFDETPKFEVLEFYIIPTHRHKMMGQRFAHLLFDQFKGNWQIKQIAGADYASTFWRNVLKDYQNGQYAEDTYQDPYWGTVTRQQFSNV